MCLFTPQEGNKEEWWTNETRSRFEERQQCFVDEYSGYGFRAFGAVPDYEGRTTVDGEKTLGENIADNGGLREAYRAYRDHEDRREEGAAAGRGLPGTLLLTRPPAG